MDSAIVIDVKDLAKTYRTPFRRKKVEALRGVSFQVQRGHIFGFVGPNGAGKTTTIRTLMGLIRPSSGSATILGHAIPSRAARFKVGFLPESPYFYDYLTIAELLDLAGRLFGLSRAVRTRRANELIERVGLARARGQSLKKFSKGMLQRAGLAQALMNDPEVVVLDEPTSGLDPIGRKEVRDLILELREQGKTVFFSSHILTDIEAIADQVAIVARGQLQSLGTPGELVQRTVLGVDITVRVAADAELGSLLDGASRIRRVADELALTLGAEADLDTWLVRARELGAKVIAVEPRHETLEDLFMRQIAGAGARLMLGRIWAIALNTFREAARIRVLYGILVLVVGANLLAIVLGRMSIHEEQRVARDIGLAGISLFGSLTAIFLGVFLLYTEVQRRTIHAIVSKPIERWEFVVGKYTGMAVVLTILVALFAAAMIAMLTWQHVGVSGAVVRAIVLAWVEVLTVAAIAIFFSSFSTPFLSGIFALAMWTIGRVTPDIEAAVRTGTGWIRWTARAALEIVPDVHLFSPSGRVIDGAAVSVHADFVTWGYVGMASLHGLGWIVGLLALACVLFHRRDFA